MRLWNGARVTIRYQLTDFGNARDTRSDRWSLGKQASMFTLTRVYRANDQIGPRALCNVDN